MEEEKEWKILRPAADASWFAEWVELAFAVGR